MPLSPYDPCPCGSGKKLKFCCQSIADEMDRALRLMEGNQPRVALQQLESLARKNPANTWVGTTRALILIELNEAAAARDILKSLLEHNPDNEFAIVLMAAATFQADGFDQAKKAVHRAFQRGAKKFPSMVSGLAATMAAIHAQRNHPMAAREHLALALRLSPEERRQELFIQLLEFDGDAALVYQLRGPHALPFVDGNDDQQKEIKKAQKYAAVGCWNTAADLFLALTRTIPDSPQLWHSVGLCRAWDGEEVLAAEALHRAAQLYGDFATAVECETLAQHFDRATTTDVVEICSYEATIQSVGRLLTILDEQPRFTRIANPPDTEREAGEPVAQYQIMDRPGWTGDFSQLTIEQLPAFQAHLSIYDAIPDSPEPPSLVLTGDRGSDLEAARSLLQSCTEGLLTWESNKPQPEVTGATPQELQPLRWKRSVPEDVPIPLSRMLKQQHWESILNDGWPNGPLKGLAGKTPAEAAGDPNLKVALTAACYVLDAHCQLHSYELDLPALLGRFGLELLPAVDIDEQTSLNTMSIMQMHRLPIDRLTDDQLVSVLNRAMLTRHSGFLYRVLKAAFSRPGCEENMDMLRSLRAIVELCAGGGRRDEALTWIAFARTKSTKDKSAFETQWNWDLTELVLRLEEPADLGIKPLLDKFVQYYAPKVPQLRGYIENVLSSFKYPSPWEQVSIVTSSAMTSPSSGLWSPDAPPAPTNPSKLWLPGE